MAPIVFIHGVGDAPGPGADEARSAWIDALAAPAPSRFDTWLRSNSAFAYYQDWDWYVGDDRAEQTATSTWSTLRRTIGDVVDEAQSAYDEVTPERLADLAEVANRWSDSDRVVTAGNQAADRVTAFNLWQVPAFLEDLDGTRTVVLDRFAAAVDDDTRVVIAHSMGSIVAFEAAHTTGIELDALITLGSPLGVEGYVRRRLSTPDRVPPGIGRWLNIAHPNEPVALVPELAPLFTNEDASQVIEDLVLETSTPWHGIDTYLRHDDVRRAIWNVLEPLVPGRAD
ncbi:MAG: hypothetical protein AAF081_15175 [Actinomycetota bacterium]